GHIVRRPGVRDLEGLRIADDGRGEGQVEGGCPSPLRAIPQDGHGPPGGSGRHLPRQARGPVRRLRVPRPREVCEPGLAHPRSGPGEEAGDRIPGVTVVSADAPRTATEDRKSTRLNSSHVSTSYAVFR